MRLMRHRSIKNGLRDVTGRDVIGRARLKLVLNLKSLLIINYNYIYNFSIQNVHVYCFEQTTRASNSLPARRARASRLLNLLFATSIAYTVDRGAAVFQCTMFMLYKNKHD